MRLIICLLLVALAAGSTAHAQAPAAPVAAADSGAVLIGNGWYLPRYTATNAADSTGALLSLFHKRRYAGWIYAVPFMAGLMLALPISSTDHYGRTTTADEAISPPVGGLVLAGTVVGFIAHASKFNKAHLVAVDKAYAAGQPIPRKYRSQLNASHFNEAAFIREALRQQMEREQQRQAVGLPAR